MSEEKSLDEIKKIWPKEVPDIKNVPKYIEKYKLSNYDANLLVDEKELSDLFEQIISDYNQRKKESISGSNGESIYNETFGMRSRIAVDDFYKRSSYINLSKNGIETLGPSVIT